MFDRKAIFLDRDGTLIQAVHRPDFIKNITAPFRIEELHFVPKVRGILASLKALGFLRIMITNQPDVANGYMTRQEWNAIHNTVVNFLDLDDFYMCRHRSEDRCPCKKPSPLMLQVAADKWGIDLTQSCMVGDTDADTKAGSAARCTTILIDAFYNQEVVADIRVATLEDVVKVIGSHRT